MAGIGNVFKTEICFKLGVTPWSPVSAVDAEKTVELARKLLLVNAWRDQRSTTGESANDRRHWVYERTRKGCFRCGGRVRVAGQGVEVQVRPTWFCPKCQQGPFPVER
jgi:endonuclease-8